MEVTCKCGDGRHTDDEFEFFTIPVRPNDALYDRSTKFVTDRMLTIVCGGDEKLVFDVDKMMGVADDIHISICN